MSSGLDCLVRQVRRMVTPSNGLTDAELLRRWVEDRDEAAFEVLLWRHAGLVAGACRRVLRHEQDAEDAFQAVFLILAKKAHTVGRGEALAPWLHRVAVRVALHARATKSRAPSPLPDEVPARPTADEVDWRGWHLEVVDEAGKLLLSIPLNVAQH